jgi:hypothetical protein
MADDTSDNGTGALTRFNDLPYAVRYELMRNPDAYINYQRQQQASDLDYTSPDIMQQAVKNPAALDILSKVVPLQQGMNFNNALSQLNNNSPQQPSAASPAPPVPASSSGTPSTTPQNNPGNLRPVGATTGFMSYPTPEAGMVAMRGDLLAKIGGSPSMKGKTPTLGNIISTYAPPSENNTADYQNYVSQNSGIPLDQPLTSSDVDKIMPPMMKYEGARVQSSQSAQAPNTPVAQSSDYSPPSLSASTQKIRQMVPFATLKMSGDQARAFQAFADNLPDYKNLVSYNDNYNSSHAHMQEKQNDDNISYAKDVHEESQNAVKLSDSLQEMKTLRNNFTPGKTTDVKAHLAAWKIALGEGDDNDKQLAASVEGEQKLAIQNVTGQLKQLSSRPSQMEFLNFLEANPNVTMSPKGFDTILQYMQKQAALPTQKEQDFSQWKENSKPSNYRDFDTQWNQKLLKNQQDRMVQVPADSDRPPLSSFHKGG